MTGPLNRRFENLTPAAAALQEHYLATFTPPSEETLRVWKSLNTPAALLEAASQPHITMHQEQMLAAMQEWEQAKNSGKRYRLASKLRKNGINPTDWVKEK